MKICKFFFFLLASCIIFSTCDKVGGNDQLDGEDPDDKENVENGDGNEYEAIFNENVVLFGADMVDYIRIVDEVTISVSNDVSEDKIPEVGDIIYYNPETSYSDIFIGRVVSVDKNETGWTIKTEMPALEDVFSNLSASLEMNSTNTAVFYDSEVEDGIKSCQIVDNSVWDNITTFYSEDMPSPDVKSGEGMPLDITLAMEVTPNEAFTGVVYIGLKGHVYFSDIRTFVMDVNMCIGISGTLGLKLEGKSKIPLLSLKNGFTLYSNKVVGLRLKPSLNFFAEGNITLESMLNYELMNTDFKISHNENDGFRNNSIEQKHDNYFRVKSVNSQGKFGFSLDGSLYAFLLSEGLFQGGANVSAEVSLGGEKSVGIQFPGLANFHFNVMATPALKLHPYVAVRKPSGLSLIKGPEFEASLDVFKISLLPSVNDVTYTFDDAKTLNVSAKVSGSKSSFVISKQEGIALFEKGADEPLKRESVPEISVKASSDNLEFDLSDGKEYELAPYVESEQDGYIYGERVDVKMPLREVLEEFYRSTNGDNWLRNDNWCTDAPIEEWYGIGGTKGSEDCYSLSLSNNNLTGNAYLGPNSQINVLVVDGNNLSGLHLNKCDVLVDYYDDWNPLSSVIISGCNSLKMISYDEASVTNLTISDCGSLVDVDCNNNQLTSIAVSDCPSLINIYCDNNKLTALDLSGCTSLEFVDCYYNQLTSLDLSGYTSLEYVDCDNNLLTSLDLSGCTSLEYVDCDNNPLTSIDLSDCTSLSEFRFSQEGDMTLTSLDLSGCTSLEDVHCSNNQLTSLDLSGCTSLESVDCDDNQLTTLNLSDCPSLRSIHCRNNVLKSLVISGSSSLTDVHCNDNQLTTLDLSDCLSLEWVDCFDNQLQSMDLSGCVSLRGVWCHNNHLNSVITDFYDNLEAFQYDIKYTDYWWENIYDANGKVIGKKLHYTKNDYGWWYPGEPDKGYHGK